MATWLQRASPQGTGAKEEDLAESKMTGEVGQPAQAGQGSQAASLLVSRAMSMVCGGLPRPTRTT